MAADSNIGYECLNTGNIQQPENAGNQSGDLADSILEEWGGLGGCHECALGFYG